MWKKCNNYAAYGQTTVNIISREILKYYKSQIWNKKYTVLSLLLHIYTCELCAKRVPSIMNIVKANNQSNN